MSIHVRWLGHSSYQIRVAGKVIYIDLKKYGKVVEASEKADIILVTHGHSDHCCPEKTQKVRKKDTIVIAPADCVKRIGGNVKSLKPGEEISLDGITIRAVEAYNVKRLKPSGEPWHPKGYGVGYLIKAEGKAIYHAGDTDFIPEMRELQNVDLALLPTGDKYTMDCAEAAEAAMMIKPKIAMAMHTWGNNSKEFSEKVEANSQTRVIVLQEGEEHKLD
ncbi:MAG: MBL fold metallo-hydrolase [Candidatus Bathyarchaeota archaeon]|jgi:L-ascorbate metabolism protein UlaG (beta-lactamase superfamily)|nr:MBL fold metallo-hydrolase [Candidatus Bathyarchaeota archaeon]